MKNRNLTKVFFTFLIGFVSFFLSFGNVFAQTGDWTSLYNNAQNTGYNSSSTIAPTLLQVWQQNLGGRIAGQVIADGVVYATVEGSPYTVKAVNASTGATLWTFQGDSGRSLSTPTIDNNTVYVAETPPGDNCSNYGYMIALNTNDGSVKWKDQSTGSYTLPAIANNTLYINSNGCNNIGTAEAISETDGSILWTASITGGPVAPPAVNGSTVFIGAPCGCGTAPDIYALNINTGATLWNANVGGQYGGDVYSQPVVSGNIVYVQSSGAGLHALNASSGAVQWEQYFITSTAPATDGTNLYLGQSQEVDSRNPSNGNLLWSYTMPGTSNGNVNVAVANGNVYATGTTNGGIVALNSSTGSVSGTFSSPSGTYFNSPAISANAVYVGDSAGNLYELNNEGPIVSAINAGGDTQGNFVADTDFNGGTTYSTSSTVDTSNVTNPAPQAVYQTVRYGNFTYTVPNLTPNTNYTLRLHFNEPYFGANGNSGGVGSRVFDVSVNGTQALSNFDIYQAAGGADKAVVEELPATSDSNGDITVQFSSVVDNAMVSGIEVDNGTPSTTPTPTPTPLQSEAINAGGPTEGSFQADMDSTNGSTYTTSSSVDISGVTNPAPEAVYQTVRYGSNFSYNLTGFAPNSSHTVRLHFSEPYWGTALSSNQGGTGSRVFNVSINGTQVLNNFDVYQTAGGADKAVIEEFPVTADSNGEISIQFTAVTDNAMVSGIEVN